jgi:hypothetical protein
VTQPGASFTVTSVGGLIRVLKTQCHACAAFDPKAAPPSQHPPFQSFEAIWDTGATASVITQAVIDKCGLKPTGMVQVHGVHGVQPAETFLVNIRLPQGVAFANIQVTRGEVRDADVLIGMDIISQGDFSITNVGGKRTVFSFRVPSLVEVDFVEQANRPKFSHGSKKKSKKRWPP